MRKNLVKWISLVALIAIVATLGVGIAAAQEDEPTPPAGPGAPGGLGRLIARFAGELVNVVAEATGLTPQQVVELARGATLAEVAEANGADVDAIVAEVVAEAAEKINQAVTDGRLTQEQADQMLANLEDHVRTAMERPLPERPGRPGERVIAELARALVSVVAEAAGLTPQRVVEQIQGGATLAEVVEADGGDVEAIVIWMVSEQAAGLNRAVATGRLSREEADQRLADYRERVVAAMNGELPFEPRRPRDVLGLNLVNTVAEAAGLTPQAVLAQARAGKTLAEMAQENGADVEAIIAQVVAETTANLEDRVREAMNRSLPAAGPGRQGEQAPSGQ